LVVVLPNSWRSKQRKEKIQKTAFGQKLRAPPVGGGGRLSCVLTSKWQASKKETSWGRARRGKKERVVHRCKTKESREKSGRE